MPAKKPRPKGEKPQRDRFIETAKELEADESGKKFEKAVELMLPAKKN
ncbi:MAG: hypothetical protein ABNH53_15390 [Henriciella sp.]|jgi:hypothetical protein